MTNLREFQLVLPSRIGEPQKPNTITTGSPLVFIGANGCGKTRLGNWIEQKQLNLVHRIAAQKSLTFPKSIKTSSIDGAHRSLLFGHETFGNKHFRWGEEPATKILDDYERLLQYLFAEEAERNAEFKRKTIASAERIEPPETKIDIIKRIWEHTLPERELIIGGGKVEVRKRSSSDSFFNASEMSDGERVVFYLIGQSLAAPSSGIIIIDEPELHLHKGIQNRLWDEIEAERTDCLFIYLTHDLDFATSRIGTTKIWLREFDGKAWDWEIVPENPDLPEPLLLRVLGSRKNILFVEGPSGGLDEEVYTHLYPKWTVTPCGSCEHVIHATGVYSSLHSLHHLQVHGLIDSDERTSSETENLQKAGVHLLGFSEIENIFLIEEVLQIAAANLLPGENADTVLITAKERVLAFLLQDKERVISKRVCRALQERTRHFHTKAVGITKITEDWDTLNQSVTPSALYNSETQKLDIILMQHDYISAIRIFPNKGLMKQVTGLFGAINLQRYLRKLLGAPNGEVLRSILRKNLPTLEQVSAG